MYLSLVFVFTCVSELEKWLQLLFMRWYRSPRNWLPTSSMIRLTSSSLKSVHPIWILCLVNDGEKENETLLNWHFCYGTIKQRLPKTKLFTQFVVVTRGDFEYTTKWKRMSTWIEKKSISQYGRDWGFDLVCTYHKRIHCHIFQRLNDRHRFLGWLCTHWSNTKKFKEDFNEIIIIKVIIH